MRRPDNPLGARVLYLYQNGVYTLYTIYSTTVAKSIGTGLTSGCTGLLSQDMIDLYSRTPLETKVVVLPVSARASVPAEAPPMPAA